jgi:hypothetical protein
MSKMKRVLTIGTRKRDADIAKKEKRQESPPHPI